MITKVPSIWAINLCRDRGSALPHDPDPLRGRQGDVVGVSKIGELEDDEILRMGRAGSAVQGQDGVEVTNVEPDYGVVNAHVRHDPCHDHLVRVAADSHPIEGGIHLGVVKIIMGVLFHHRLARAWLQLLHDHRAVRSLDEIRFPGKAGEHRVRGIPDGADKDNRHTRLAAATEQVGRVLDHPPRRHVGFLRGRHDWHGSKCGLFDDPLFLRMTPNDDPSLPSPRRLGNRRKIHVDVMSRDTKHILEDRRQLCCNLVIEFMG